MPTESAEAVALHIARPAIGIRTGDALPQTAAPSPRWYVVFTKPRQEHVALRNLCQQGYTAWLPMHTAWQRRAGAWLAARTPLFPRYAFACTEDPGKGIGPIRSTFGVTDLVRFGGQPATVGQMLIDALRSAEARLADAPQCGISPFKHGDAVRIASGPFNGLEGVVSRVAGERVAVLLHILGREKAIDFAVAALGPRVLDS